ncbi:6-N-hydroxylaminopurine resistance protein [compost metagenome]
MCIGDVYQIGDVILQVSQPRYPCFKLIQKHGVADLPAQVLQTGFSGYYFRVLQEGYLSDTAIIQKRESHPEQVRVIDVLRLLASKGNDRDKETLQRMVELDVLAAGIRGKFHKWLDEAVS